MKWQSKQSQRRRLARLPAADGTVRSLLTRLERLSAAGALGSQKERQGSAMSASATLANQERKNQY